MNLNKFPKYILGRSNLAMTIFVSYDCPNHCPFCTSKEDLILIESDSTTPEEIKGIEIADEEDLPKLVVSYNPHSGLVCNSFELQHSSKDYKDYSTDDLFSDSYYFSGFGSCGGSPCGGSSYGGGSCGGSSCGGYGGRC